MTTSAIDSASQTGVPAGGHYVHRLVREFLDARQQDCMELMAEYPDKHFDLAIVDPPYGIGDKFKGGKTGKMQFNEVVEKGWDVAPAKEYFDELERVSRNQIIWGGNYFHLPPAALLDNLGQTNQRGLLACDG